MASLCSSAVFSWKTGMAGLESLRAPVCLCLSFGRGSARSVSRAPPHCLSTWIGLLTVQQLGSEREHPKIESRFQENQVEPPGLFGATLRSHIASLQNMLLMKAVKRTSGSRGGNKDPTSFFFFLSLF